ncbi:MULTISPECIES: NarL family transcriptional regulator [unclassified Microcoleus]|uniref:NarL family transcriptional regulator n=1 Tax=unclassified Microcoleus TaxID=2642155 RepID=UPI002FD5FA30
MLQLKQIPNIVSERQLPVVNSYNEWDPLKEVIVGCVEGAVVPKLEPALLTNTSPQNLWFFQKYGGQPFPQELVEAASKELNEFCQVLEAEGVTVRRPDRIDFSQTYKTPDFEASGFYATMPRDVLIVVGNEIIEAPMAWRSRFFEYRAYRSLMVEYLRRGAKWTPAPKPSMSDEFYDLEYATKPIDRRYALTEKGQFVTGELEPSFDAADIVRFGRDLFVQRSHVTNEIGITWLKRHLGDQFRVHVVKFPDLNPMHIDASLVPLRPGLALVNPARRCIQTELFKKAGWELVDAAPSTLPDNWPMYMCSSWVCMNILSLDPETIFVEKQEEPMQKLLKDLGFKVIPVDFRHVYTFGGSFHCVTCDVRRDGQLEEYGFTEPLEEDELEG